MAQHDYVIDNGPGLAVRTDINAVLQAIVSNNAGNIEPQAMFPGMMWLDTSITPDGQLRMRNQGNTGWVNPGIVAFGGVVTTAFWGSGAFTANPLMLYCEVWGWGGGGAGGGHAVTAATTYSAAGGGHAGALAYGVFDRTTVGASQAVTIGAGGAGVAGGVGGNGGDTSFGTLLVAAGGNGSSAGGTSSANAYMAVNGAPIVRSSAGQLLGWTPAGGRAFGGAAVNAQMGGDGGETIFGGSGRGAVVAQGSGAGAGGGGANPGSGSGGGGAAAQINNASTRPGGPGGSGVLIVKQYLRGA